MSINPKSNDTNNRETRVLEKKKQNTINPINNEDSSNNNVLTSQFKLVNKKGIIYIVTKFNGRLIYFKQDTSV